jgi:hypothetical protein
VETSPLQQIDRKRTAKDKPSCLEGSEDKLKKKTHVVSLNQISRKDLSSTDTAVVGSLRAGVAALGPSERPSIGVEEGVLLLESEPGLVLLSQRARGRRRRSDEGRKAGGRRGEDQQPWRAP